MVQKRETPTATTRKLLRRVNRLLKEGDLSPMTKVLLGAECDRLRLALGRENVRKAKVVVSDEELERELRALAETYPRGSQKSRVINQARCRLASMRLQLDAEGVPGETSTKRVHLLAKENRELKISKGLAPRTSFDFEMEHDRILGE